MTSDMTYRLKVVSITKLPWCHRRENKIKSTHSHFIDVIYFLPRHLKTELPFAESILACM